MRRALAITLLLALASPLVAPLLAATADPEASLPACCRSHGAHHCAMLHMQFPAGPAFTAPPCSNYPAIATPPRIATASLADPSALLRTSLHTSEPQRSSCRSAYSLVLSITFDRGPPVLHT